MSDPSSERDPLDKVTEAFLARHRAGEQPGVSDYVREYPELTEQIRKLFPVLLMMEGHGLEAGEPRPEGEVVIAGQLGDFRILREIGRGGMGIVYEAEQLSLGRHVALKVLPAAATLDPKQLQRFKNEAQAAAHLQHSNIVAVHAVGCDRGVHYYAMQLIEGQSLATLISSLRNPAATSLTALAGATPPSSSGSLPTAVIACHDPETAAPLPRSIQGAGYFRMAAILGIQAAQALEHAHQLGVIHRDVKPANLLVDRRSDLWVTDFGLALLQGDARLTLSGDLVGTLRYMSPEQALARHGLVDHRTDIYSLGVTLYELLTLQPPFEGHDRQELLRQIAFDEPPAPSRRNKAIPVDLETIVVKAMAKNPPERYATAQDLAEDLRFFLAGKPIQARRPTMAQRAARWARRHLAVVVTAGLAAAAVLLTAVGTLAIGLWQVQAEKRRTDEQRQQAQASQQRAETSYRLARQALEECVKKVADDPRLKSGPLEDLRRVVREAELIFYRKFVALQGDEAEFQVERGRAFWQLANLYLETGRSGQAENAYLEARAIFEQLVETHPSVDEYRSDLAHSYNQLGKLYHDTGRNKSAEDAYLNARTMRERLVNAHPELQEHKHELAGTWNNLGIFYYTTGRNEHAEHAYQSALEIRRRLAAARPKKREYQRELALGYNNLAVLYKQTGRDALAEQAWKDALAIQEHLVELYPDDADCQEDLAISHMGLAVWYKDSRRLVEAEAAYQKALTSYQHLARTHPQTVAYENGVVAAYSNLGDLYGITGAGDRAQAALKEGLRISERLANAHPEITSVVLLQGVLASNLGSVIRDSSGPREALPWYARAISTLESVLKKEPQDSQAREFVRDAYKGRADALDRLGRFPDALADWDRALASDDGRMRSWLRLRRAMTRIRAKDYPQGIAEAEEVARDKGANGDTLYDVACVYSLAAATVREDMKLRSPDRNHIAEDYAIRAVATLKDALGKGYKDLDHVKKDPDLQALHSRADFQELLGQQKK
jgi:serine/threonine protein kinase/tetratricopeptide (TPR) repeat protein